MKIMWAEIGQLFGIFLVKGLITCPLSMSELKAYIYHMGYPLAKIQQTAVFLPTSIQIHAFCFSKFSYRLQKLKGVFKLDVPVYRKEIVRSMY